MDRKSIFDWKIDFWIKKPEKIAKLGSADGAKPLVFKRNLKMRRWKMIKKLPRPVFCFGPGPVQYCTVQDLLFVIKKRKNQKRNTNGGARAHPVMTSRAPPFVLRF